MNRSLTFLFLILIVVTGCNNRNSEAYNPVINEKTEEKKEIATKIHSGKKLMETQCYICHSPSAAEKEGRIGPPMIAIKAHYIDDETTKEVFTDAMWNFLKNPSKDRAKLRGAVRRFGVMPYQPFKKEEIVQIAEYIYDYQIDEPSWFKEHWENGHKKKRKPYKNNGKIAAGVSDMTVKDVGLSYALGTKKVLGKNLMGTIQAKGTLEALTFCNEKAYPLTDSMATQFNATIKRVSDKPRNPNNKANIEELEKIEYFKELIANDKKTEPVVEKKNGYNQFYYPITTNTMCLQCHGEPNEQITSEVLATINSLYPNDLAKGYKINQVRGIWSITFKDAKNE
ncbi:DUF3365 domain-containing protein [Winogradskyella sp.]|uniref:Tll0287-like domain-containing protein n=1 Tax=Winogradskyella sp. TaxID=1883156 RepID=UPI0026227724|nr:DUF3365 domain-containing protein [Winogradskyella sp.]